MRKENLCQSLEIREKGEKRKSRQAQEKGKHPTSGREKEVRVAAELKKGEERNETSVQAIKRRGEDAVLEPMDEKTADFFACIHAVGKEGSRNTKGSFFQAVRTGERTDMCIL